MNRRKFLFGVGAAGAAVVAAPLVKRDETVTELLPVRTPPEYVGTASWVDEEVISDLYFAHGPGVKVWNPVVGPRDLLDADGRPTGWRI